MDVDEFQATLRVLAVDDDRVSLILIAKQLRFCKYNVTTVMHPEMALEMLRARRDSDDQFDLVITDVHMPEMDGFKLLELISLEMDIPVIMLSANGTLAPMKKGIQHGARDYLVKPVHLEQLKRLCIHKGRKVNNDPNNCINCNDNNEGESESGANHTIKCLRKKRRDGDSARGGKENISTPKRQRIQWSGELHREFVNVINQIGIDKAVPKKILEMMNVEGLTRGHVASHLQKFRLYMKKLSDGTFKSNNPFTNEALWRQGNFININLQEHFKHSLEHGTYQPSLSFANSSNSSNPFARMNTPAAFGTHSLLPTHSVQLMSQRNLAIPVKDIGPTGYGANMPQVALLRSHQGLSNFTCAPNSHKNICFASCSSGSSFANISNGMPFNTSDPFPSRTWRNSSASIPNGSSPLASNMEPQFCSFKSYARMVHGDLDGASSDNPFVDGNSSKSVENGEMLPPSTNSLPMHPSQSVAPFGLSGSTNSGKTMITSTFLDHGCKDTMFEAGSSQGNMHKINKLSRLATLCGNKSEFQNQMAALTRTTSTPMANFNEQVAPFDIGNNTNSITMKNDNCTHGGASSLISTLPSLHMNKPILMPSQMLTSGFEGGIIDLPTIGDQLSNNNELPIGTSSSLNGENDTLDHFFDDLINQDVLKNDDTFMNGDWEFMS